MKKTNPEKGAGQKPIRTGLAHVDDLYNAVISYVESGGGKLTVIGGIEVQEWPQDNAGIFKVAVKCLGRKPTFVAKDK